jgi:ABC-type sugar transport system ATPase subunit
MSSLKLGERQLVEIIKALARKAAMVILDEPTASLTNDESARLFSVLGNLARQGVGIVYISHRMDEVYRFSDRVDVFRNGRLVASAKPVDTTPAQLIEHMLGQAAEVLAPPRPRPTVEVPVVRITDWSSPGAGGLASVSFSVARGEIVALFGLRGAGQELVAEGLAGLAPGVHGRVEVAGRECNFFSNPRAAQSAGISYVPAERKRDGLVLPLSVQANLTLLVLGKVSFLGVLNGNAERRIARDLVKRLSVRSRGITQPVGELSGGNQQKVLVGSRLARLPVVFVLREPTRGVDVGARIEIHRFLRDLAGEGAGMLVVTSDVEEAVVVSDRLLVMRDGALVAELTGESKTQSQALSIATKAA